MSTRDPEHERRSQDDGLSVFERDLIGGLEDYVGALAADASAPDRRFKERLVVHRDAPQAVKKDKILKVRRSLNASQAVFAALLGVSPASVASWERGNTQPNPTARRLIWFMDRDPGRWSELMQSFVQDELVEA